MNAYINTLIALYTCLDNLLFYQVVQNRAERRQKVLATFQVLKTTFERVESEEIEKKLQSIIKLN